MIITHELLNVLSAQAKENAQLRQNFDLRNSNNDQSQRMLNALEPGTIVPIHRHTQSSEVVVVIRYFYDENGHITETITLKYGEETPMLVIPKGVWHNLECLETGTIIYESKDGVYQPTPEEDILKI